MKVEQITPTDDFVTALKKINDYQQKKNKSKVGHWVFLDNCSNEGFYCSECQKRVFRTDFSHTMKLKNFKFCPNCGSPMEIER